MFPDRLVMLRKENKKTQQNVADYLGITRPAYTAYELGSREPDFDTLQKLADFFDVSTDYLLGRTETRKISSDDGSEIEKLMEDPDFMVAYKEYPGSPEEAKEDLIGFLKLIKERDERKKRK